MTGTRPTLGAGAFGPEPAHDRKLGALLGEVTGDTPHGAVQWSALAERIGNSVAAQMAMPWWRYATRWERSVIPLALAAGLSAAVALWSTAEASAGVIQVTSASGAATSVLSGTPADDAASLFVRSVTNQVELTAGVPE